MRRRNDSTIHQFNTPMLHSSGWYAFHTEGAIETFNACHMDGGPKARGKQKLLIGPRGHGVFQEEELERPLRLPSGISYPPNSNLRWEQDVWLPWFDYWLKGRETGVMDQPAVRYYLMGDVDDPRAPGNEWIEVDRFPPESLAIAYYIHADAELITERLVAESASVEYQFDPKDPVPTVGRFYWNVPVKGPYDQSELEKRSDVLVFTTEALEKPLQIVGKIRVKLWASSNRIDTDFTAKVSDVYPDGRSMLISDSIVKGKYRNTYFEEEFLNPDQVYEFEIDLSYTAIVLAPGHHLRLAISSSNFDRFDINPNTGEPYGDHALPRSLLKERLRRTSFRGEPEYSDSLVATNTIYMDRNHPTHIVLPVIDDKIKQ